MYRVSNFRFFIHLMVGSLLVVAEVPFFYSAGHLGGRLFRGQSRQPGWWGFIWNHAWLISVLGLLGKPRISPLWSILGSKLKAQSGAPILVGFDIRFWSTYFCFHFVSILSGVWIMKIGSPTWRCCQQNSGNPLLGRLRGTSYVGISSVFSLAGYPRLATLRWGYMFWFSASAQKPRDFSIKHKDTHPSTKTIPGDNRNTSILSMMGLWQKESSETFCTPKLDHKLPGLVNSHIANLKMAIEIVDLPIKNCDFP